MMKAFLLSVLIPAVLAQSPVWGQCGGSGWTGPKTCTSGNCCTFSNDWYSQCIPGNCNGGGNPTTTIRATTTAGGTPSSTPSTPSTGGGTAGCGKAPTLTSGIKSITINGKNRRYTLRVPNNYNQNKQYKVVFGFHWLNGNMGSVTSANYYGLVPLANEGTIFVAPDGLNAGWGNAGGEDIAFVDALNNLIDNGLCVNPKQRYATGFSYGGAMSHSVACTRAGVFRAVAVIAGAQLSGCSGGTTPIAYLGIHGVADSVLNISQGRSLRDKWLGLAKCQSQNAPEPARGSGSHIKTTYTGCTSGYPVVWIAHSGDHVPDPRDNGQSPWAPGETWNFFTQNS